MFKYDLSAIFTVGKWEPFVGIGPGYTWFENQKYPMKSFTRYGLLV